MESGNTEYAPVFSGDVDVENDALIGFTNTPTELYILGYQMAAERLVEAIRDEREPPDVLIYPIVYLYRHYLELRIKEICRLAMRLDHQDGNPMWGHDLEALWSTTLQLVQELPALEDEDLSDLDFATHVIKAFANLDPRSTTFRYPDQIQGENPLDGLERINVARLSSMVKEASASLEGLAAWLAQLLEWEYDMLAESGYPQDGHW